MTKREDMEAGGKLQLTVEIVDIQGVEWPLIEVQPTTGRHVVGLLLAPALYEAAEYAPPPVRTFEFGDWVQYDDQRHGRVVRIHRNSRYGVLRYGVLRPGLPGFISAMGALAQGFASPLRRAERDESCGIDWCRPDQLTPDTPPPDDGE